MGMGQLKQRVWSFVEWSISSPLSASMVGGECACALVALREGAALAKIVVGRDVVHRLFLIVAMAGYGDAAQVFYRMLPMVIARFAFCGRRWVCGCQCHA